MKKKTYLLMALTMVSMGMNAQNSGNSSLEKGIEEFTKTMTIGGTSIIRWKTAGPQMTQTFRSGPARC